MKFPFTCGGIVFLQIFLVGCSSGTPSAGHVVTTLISPRKTVKALIVEPKIEGGLGATLSQPYQVWMQDLRPDMEAEKMLVFEADKTNGVHLSWTTEGQLEICYSKAQIGHFRNQFLALDKKSQTVTDEIEVVLKRVRSLTDC